MPAAWAWAIAAAYPGLVTVPGPLSGLKMIIPTVGAAAMIRCHCWSGSQ